MYHGEKVVFCTLVQLVLEDADPLEIQAVVGFCKDVGLSTTLKELGKKEIKEAIFCLTSKYYLFYF